MTCCHTGTAVQKPLLATTAFFSMERQATQPRKDRTLSGWYGEQAGVEVAPPPPTNSIPNQDDCLSAGQELCQYHDLGTFKKETPPLSSFQLQPGQQATSEISVMAG